MKNNKRFIDSNGNLWKITVRKPKHGVLKEIKVHRYLNNNSGWMSESLMRQIPEDVKAWKDIFR